ncbi:MAG: hypothetical protein MJA30_19825 [Cytophagales bacterium]|nr:hypothetical protein [Cytophagales bacterium]
MEWVFTLARIVVSRKERIKKAHRIMYEWAFLRPLGGLLIRATYLCRAVLQACIL